MKRFSLPLPLRRTGADGAVTAVGGDPLAGVAHGDYPRLLGLAVEPDGRLLVGVAGGWGKTLGVAAVLALVLWGLARVWRRGRSGPRRR